MYFMSRSLEKNKQNRKVWPKLFISITLVNSILTFHLGTEREKGCIDIHDSVALV